MHPGTRNSLYCTWYLHTRERRIQRQVIAAKPQEKDPFVVHCRESYSMRIGQATNIHHAATLPNNSRGKARAELLVPGNNNGGAEAATVQVYSVRTVRRPMQRPTSLWCRGHSAPRSASQPPRPPQNSSKQEVDTNRICTVLGPLVN